MNQHEFDADNSRHDDPRAAGEIIRLDGEGWAGNVLGRMFDRDRQRSHRSGRWDEADKYDDEMRQAQK